MRKRITSNQRQEYQAILYNNNFGYNHSKSDYYVATFVKKNIDGKEVRVKLGTIDRTVCVYTENKIYNSLDGLLTSTKEFKDLIESL